MHIMFMNAIRFVMRSYNCESKCLKYINVKLMIVMDFEIICMISVDESLA